MMGDRQSQEGGHSSTNIQAHGDVTIGLGYSDVKEIAMDVFKANFMELKNIAAQVAFERAESLLDNYLKRAAQEGQPEIPEAENPDFQYVLFSAQKEHARIGDEDVGDLLVQLLVDRTKVRDRNLVQIALNESLDVAPKLTPDQLDALSLVFLLGRTINHTVNSLDRLAWYLDTYILPFALEASSKDSAYQHLEYAGCGAVSINSFQIEEALRQTYMGLFCKGFTEEEAKLSI